MLFFGLGLLEFGFEVGDFVVDGGHDDEGRKWTNEGVIIGFRGWVICRVNSAPIGGVGWQKVGGVVGGESAGKMDEDQGTREKQGRT